MNSKELNDLFEASERLVAAHDAQTGHTTCDECKCPESAGIRIIDEWLQEVAER